MGGKSRDDRRSRGPDKRILICASGAKFVDDFCLELPVTRGKSFAATPRHLHQGTIRLN